MRMAAGAFGIALEGVVLYRRTPFHQLDLADHFGGRRFSSLDLVQQFSDKLEIFWPQPRHGDEPARSPHHAGGVPLGGERCLFVGELRLSRIGCVRMARPSHPCRLAIRAEELRKALDFLAPARRNDTAVTVPPNPKGLPTAITQSPTRGVVVANSTALLDQRQHQHPERRQKNEDRKLEFVDFFSGQNPGS